MGITLEDWSIDGQGEKPFPTFGFKILIETQKMKASVPFKAIHIKLSKKYYDVWENVTFEALAPLNFVIKT